MGDAFFREVMAYRPMLRRALGAILGYAQAEEVFHRLAEAEAVGANMKDPGILEALGAFLRGGEEDLGFYVFTVMKKGTVLTVGESGLVTPLGTHMETRPYFFIGDETVDRCASRVSSYGLEQRYFFPWLHEFAHFLCYCLQKQPLMAGLAVLSSALAHRGYPIRQLDQVEPTLHQHKDKSVEEMGRTLGLLTLLNEAMALWWEGELLDEMVLKAGDYLTDRAAKNPYVGELKALARAECLHRIRHWDRAVYHPDPFSRTFSGSFRNMKMDRWGFLGGGCQRSEVGGQGTEDRSRRTEVGGQKTDAGRYLAGKTVAILGAGGVLGRHLAMQAVACGPKKLLLVSESENELGKAYEDLMGIRPSVDCEAVPLSISDPDSMAHFLDQHAPHILFHTETWKVLEFCENQPMAALAQNFVATARVAALAEKAGVERFIFLSTVKAGRPESYFAVSYRLAELFLKEMAKKGMTRFLSVRVGNLLDPEDFLVRYMMGRVMHEGVVVLPLPDRQFWFLSAERAARLAIQAGGMGKGGEVFSLPRGEQISLRWVAENFCHVPGKRVSFEADPARWDEWLLKALTLEEDDPNSQEKATDVDGIWRVDTDRGAADSLRRVMNEVMKLVEQGDEAGIARLPLV